MIVIKKLLLFVFIIFYLCFCSVNAENKQSIQEISYICNEMAIQYLEFIKQGNYKDAVKMLHYPPGYNEEVYNRDITNLTKVIIFLHNKFGNITYYKKADGIVYFFEINLTIPEPSYWDKYPLFYKITYEINFEKVGKGYIAAWFCKVIDKWEIRSIVYGLDPLKPDYIEVMSEVISEMDNRENISN